MSAQPQFDLIGSIQIGPGMALQNVLTSVPMAKGVNLVNPVEFGELKATVQWHTRWVILLTSAIVGSFFYQIRQINHVKLQVNQINVQLTRLTQAFQDFARGNPAARASALLRLDQGQRLKTAFAVTHLLQQAITTRQPSPKVDLISLESRLSLLSGRAHPVAWRAQQVLAHYASLFNRSGSGGKPLFLNIHWQFKNDRVSAPIGSRAILFKIQHGLVTVKGGRLTGGTQPLDHAIWNGVTFNHVRIVYHGGPFQLINVHFVHCTFDLPDLPNSRRIILAAIHAAVLPVS